VIFRGSGANSEKLRVYMQKYSSYAAQNTACILPYEVLMIKLSKIKGLCSKTWFSQSQGPPCIIPKSDIVWNILNVDLMNFEALIWSLLWYWYETVAICLAKTCYMIEPDLCDGVEWP
jgi:hypothetical protein